MEYRRGRKRRRRRTERGEAGRAIAALLMIAAIVYLVGASATGNWAARNVIAPAMEAVQRLFDRNAEPVSAQSSADSPEPSAGPVSLTEERSAVTVELTLPAVYCCALQMGVYADIANAEKQSDALQAVGAGGYILQDGDGRYRVLAAGYGTEAEAGEVKERLKEEGTDCALFILQADAASYRVSAEATQLSGVEAGFGAIAAAQEALTAAAIAFDRDGLSIEQGKAEAQAILGSLKEGFSLLTAYEGDNAMLKALLSCYANCADALGILAGSSAGSTTAFSADFKHAQLYVTDQYAALMESLH